MKKLLFYILLSSLTLFAKPTCHTVQIISSVNNEKNRTALESQKFDESCKIFNINSMLTVRCGCYENYQDAKEHLNLLKQEHKNSYITSTYKERFEPLLVVEETTTSLVERKEEIQIESLKSEQNSSIVPIDIIPDPVENFSVIEHNISEPVAVAQALPKKESEVSNKKSEEKEKKKKDKSKDKVKYIKKRAADYDYQKYLEYLSSKKPLGPYGYEYSFGGHFSYDFAYIDQVAASQADNGSFFANEWRRMRLSHEGSIFDKSLFYEMEYSFSGNNNFKDFYGAYEIKLSTLDTRFRIKAGNIKVPFSLSSYSSSKNLSLMERPLGDTYALGRKVGVELLLNPKVDDHSFNLFASLFSNSIDERQDQVVSKPGFSLRTAYVYKFSKKRLFYIGLGLISQDYSGQELHYQEGSESDLLTKEYVSMRIKNTDSVTNSTLDFLYLDDKYALEAAYTKADVTAAKGNYLFSSYYIEGSYFIWGNAKRFSRKDAKYSSVKPHKDGSFELAARYSYIDLNDRDELGGEQSNYNFGFNWYYTKELRLMLNYIMATPKGTDDYDGVLNIYQMRVQFAF